MGNTILPIIFFLLFLFSYRICAQQQNYVFQHLTTKDGLASDVVTYIFQDSKKFYWVGTENGWQKFDGKSFSNLPVTHERGNSQILMWPDQKPVEDHKGNIWSYSHGCIYVYHLNGKVEPIRINDETTDTIAADIQSFCMDEWGAIWIVTRLNIYRYDSATNKCIAWLSLGPKAEHASTTTILYDSHKKSLWLARDRDILLINIQNKKVSQPFFSSHPDKTDVPEGYYIATFWMDSKQNLWFSSWNGLLYKYNTITNKEEVYDVFNKLDKSQKQIIRSIPTCFLEDNHGIIWIGALYGGLSYYDEKDNTIRLIPADNKIPVSLHYDYHISALLCDNEGNILVCTDKGISIFNPSFQQFNTIDENAVTDPFPKTDVTQLFEGSNGDIAVGTWGSGWLLYDRNFRLKKRFYHSSESSVDDKENRKNFTWCFTEDPNGKIWIGYQYGLIGIFDTATQHINYIDVPQFERKTIKAIVCDAAGNIWFGLHSGFLGKWDVTRHQFFIYKNTITFPDKEAASIISMFINRQDEIWVATQGNGFYCFDAVKEKVVERFAEKQGGSAFDNLVTSLTQLNDSVMGVSTSTKGFLLFNKSGKTISSYSVKNGLPTNEVYGLAQDIQKNIWIATTKGILRMDKDKHRLISFNEEDGVLNKRFLANFLTLRDGRMAVPTSTGFVYFSPDHINSLPLPPDVQLTGFKVFDYPILIDSVLSSGNSSITLNYNQNFITVTYASVSILGRNTTQYFYQLTDVDKEWIDAGTQRFASYTALSPGHYTFKIKCRNRDGIASNGVTELSIYIRPPWWLTWWAYVLYALVAGSIIYALYQNHIRRLKREQAAQLKAMVATQEEERKRISRDLHDDVGTKLSALKLFLSSLHEKATNTNNEEIRSLAESSEQIITEAVQDVRQLLLNLSPSVLEEFGYTTAIEGLVNKINETNLIYFNLVIFGMKHRLKKEYELALYRITQELINNVLKHAEAKQVSLQIGQRDEKIILMIEDDGKGFDLSSHKDGYGLHNLEARTKLMQGIMTIDSKPGRGTSVLIEIPYNFN